MPLSRASRRADIDFMFPIALLLILIVGASSTKGGTLGRFGNTLTTTMERFFGATPQPCPFLQKGALSSVLGMGGQTVASAIVKDYGTTGTQTLPSPLCSSDSGWTSTGAIRITADNSIFYIKYDSTGPSGSFSVQGCQDLRVDSIINNATMELFSGSEIATKLCTRSSGNISVCASPSPTCTTGTPTCTTGTPTCTPSCSGSPACTPTCTLSGTISCADLSTPTCTAGSACPSGTTLSCTGATTFTCSDDIYICCDKNNGPCVCSQGDDGEETTEIASRPGKYYCNLDYYLGTEVYGLNSKAIKDAQFTQLASRPMPSYICIFIFGVMPFVVIYYLMQDLFAFVMISQTTKKMLAMVMAAMAIVTGAFADLTYVITKLTNISLGYSFLFLIFGTGLAAVVITNLMGLTSAASAMHRSLNEAHYGFMMLRSFGQQLEESAGKK